MESLYELKLPLSAKTIEDLKEKAEDFVSSQGILVKTILQGSLSFNPLSFQLLPTLIPREAYRHAQDLQLSFNILISKVSQDFLFMEKCLKTTIDVDSFTRNLWNIYKQTYQSQIYSMAIMRSDYLFDSTKNSFNTFANIKQVEINTIAASFGSLSTKMSLYAKYILSLLQVNSSDSLPDNPAETVIAGGLVRAWELFGDEKSIIVFAVNETEDNILDQRFLEYAIARMKPKIKIERHTLDSLVKNCALSVKNDLLINEQKVAVVYYRTAYSPTQLPHQAHWDVRLLIEQSTAIKCPTVGYQLAGTKKIQQVLSTPNVVEKYITEPGVISSIRTTFANQYSLGLTEGDDNVKLALDSPDDFIIKPQREGGDNNIYGKDITEFLNKHKSSTERNAYILMERIKPMIISNYPVVGNKKVSLTEQISELGVYGVVINKNNDIVFNSHGGHLLRTKSAETNEGGLMTGSSTLDSPYLY